MEKLQVGEVAVLENGQEYVCFGVINENGVDYAYLISKFKPLKVRFVEQQIINNELLLKIVEDQQLKVRLLELFKNKNGVQS